MSTGPRWGLLFGSLVLGALLARLFTARARTGAWADASAMEPDFYRMQNPDLAPLRGDQALVRHYRQFGRQEGRIASRTQALAALASAHGVLPRDFDPPVYLALNPDVEQRLGADPWEATLHYLMYGRRERRRYYPTGGGDPREADLASLASIVALHPDCVVARYDLALHYRASGEAEHAVGQLRRALEITPYDLAMLTLSIELLTSLGQAAAAADLATAAGRLTGPDQTRFLVLQESWRFSAEYGRDWALQQCRRLEAGPDYLQADQVAARIRAALDGGRGFSLVRLGDGEGAFLRLSDADEAQFPNLYAYSREDRARVWFDGELSLAQSGFMSTATELQGAIRRADVLGLPYASWVAHEYLHVSIAGIPSLVKVLRAVSAWSPPGQAHCAQTVQLQLFESGWLGEILRRESELGLICCHPGLPERLRQVFGIDIIEFHKLPGEKSMRDTIGDAAASGVHYPDVFDATMQALSRPLQGRLFLVAGGLLGKLYCDRIKAWGGVAVDIGSLADAWVGAPTRPSFGPGLKL